MAIVKFFRSVVVFISVVFYLVPGLMTLFEVFIIIDALIPLKFNRQAAQ